MLARIQKSSLSYIAGGNIFGTEIWKNTLAVWKTYNCIWLNNHSLGNLLQRNETSVQLDLNQSLSHVRRFATSWTAARRPSLSITNSQSLLKLMSIKSLMPSNHLILCRPLLLLPPIPPASGSFPMTQFFASGGPRIGVSASASVLPMNIPDWSPLGWTGWISLLSEGLSRVFSNTTVQKHQFFGAQLSLWANSHIHTWLPEKPYLWLYGPPLAK